MGRFGGYVFLFVFLSFADGQNDVRMPPYITESPMKSYIFRDDGTVTLDCKGGGIPPVNYEWKKNGAALNLNAQNIKRGVDGTVTIQPATTLDVGYYQCFVSNQYGTALSNTSHLQKAFLEQGAGTPTVASLTATEGEPFHIQAIAKKSFPSATSYAWEIATDALDKNPSTFTPSQRVQIADNGDLYFAYATPEDALSNRLYKCTTYNQYLDIKASGGYTRVTVTRGAQNQFAPTLAFSSEAGTVGLIGEQVSLRCFFSGNPVSEISWRGPKNTLPRGRYSTEKFGSELILRNLVASDEGDYTCTGRNSKGSIPHRLQLKIEAKPVFKSPADGPQNKNVTDGEDAVFNCDTQAIPVAMVVWLQNGRAIDANAPPPKFAFSNGGKTLTVRNVCRDCKDPIRQTDLTVIQCNASNVHGYAFASGYLNVLVAKTRIISKEREEVSVDGTVDNSLKFECDAAFNSSTPSTARWYRVKDGSVDEELVYPAPPELDLKPVPGKPSVILSITIPANRTDLWAKHRGEYRCIADNGYTKAKKVVVLTVQYYVPPPVNHKGRGTWLIAVIAIAAALIVFVLLILLFARLRKRDLPRNNFESETDSRWRAARNEDSSLPVNYNALQYDGSSTINYPSPSAPPPPYHAAIQSTY